MNGYVQTTCPKCGNAAWGHPMQAVPCNTCGQQVPAMAQPQGWSQQPGMGAFGAAPGMQAQQPQQPQQAWGSPPPVAGHAPAHGGAPYGAPQPGFGAPPHAAQAGAGKINMPLPYGIKLPISIGGGMGFKIIGGVVLAIGLAVGGFILKSKFTTPKGMLSYGSLGLAKGKPDADAMYTSLAKPAKKWKKDAMFWSLNYQAVRADGTVDVSKGAEVVYVSPSASGSHAKSVRNNSIKKYGFSTAGVNHKRKWGFTDVVEGIEAHPEPTCKVKDVVALLAKQGLTGNKTVRITFDPKFADYYAWRVIGSDPKMDALFSWDNCAPIK